MKPEDLKRRQKGTTDRGEQAAPTLPTAGLGRKRRKKGKRLGGGRRNPLIRLDSEKEIQGFYLISLRRIWILLHSAWISLRNIWISFRGIRKSFIALRPHIEAISLYRQNASPRR
jgi:hypothetical protein